VATRQGIDALIADVNQRLTRLQQQGGTTDDFIREIAEQYAFIRLQDVGRPLQFLRQMAGAPPRRFGTRGFRRELVDDQNPVRHYTAFVFVGYWLPLGLGMLVLWAWEILGFVRYRGHWSQPDIRNGGIGLRHGREVRRAGAAVLPTLITRDLAAR